MLTALHMEPVATALEAYQVATLEEGRIYATVFRFPGFQDYGVRFWRWTKFRGGWKRAQLFQAADVEPLSILLRQVYNLADVPAPPPDAKPIMFELRDYAPNAVVEKFRHGAVETFISDPLKPKPIEPFFVLRRRDGHSRETASWFYTSDVEALQKSLDDVRNWFQQHD